LRYLQTFFVYLCTFATVLCNTLKPTHDASRAQIYPAGRASDRLRLRSGTQRQFQPMNRVVQRALHATAHSHVGNVFPGLVLRGAGAVLGARRRRIVDHVLIVSPGYIGHCCKKVTARICWRIENERGDVSHASPMVMSPVHFWRTRSAKGRGSSCKSQSCRMRSCTSLQCC
jgi:hypothetical protein